MKNEFDSIIIAIIANPPQLLQMFLPKKTTFIISDRANQLGNRLFLFAHFIACAIENDFIVVNPCFEEYANFFKVTKMDLFCRYPRTKTLIAWNVSTRIYLSKFICRLVSSLADGKLKGFMSRNLTIIKSGHESTQDKSRIEKGTLEFNLNNKDFLCSIASNQLILCQGPLFRDFPSIQKHSDEIRAYFQPLDIYANNINRLITSIKEQCDILVGVHIRWGDYSSFLEGKYFYTLSEYLTVMQKVEDLFPEKRVGFLIASNIKQEKNHFASHRHFFPSGHIIEDMYSLARCDYIIGPPSTYSLWASFYGKVPLYTITYPSQVITIDDFQVNDG